jgi:hypothetical protein
MPTEYTHKKIKQKCLKTNDFLSEILQSPCGNMKWFTPLKTFRTWQSKHHENVMVATLTNAWKKGAWKGHHIVYMC